MLEDDISVQFGARTYRFDNDSKAVCVKMCIEICEGLWKCGECKSLPIFPVKIKIHSSQNFAGAHLSRNSINYSSRLAGVKGDYFELELWS